MGDSSGNPAKQFHHNRKHIQEMFSLVETNYYLTETLKNDIYENWSDLPKPSLYPGLNHLLNKIFGMYTATRTSFIFSLDTTFKLLVKKIIQEAVSFQKAYEEISKKHETYLEIRNSLEQLNALASAQNELTSQVDQKFQDFVLSTIRESSSFQEAKELILSALEAYLEIRNSLEQLNALSSAQNELTSQVDQKFQGFVLSTIQENSSFQEAKELILSMLEAYLEIRNSLIFFDLFSEFLSRVPSLEKLKSAITVAYSQKTYSNSKKQIFKYINSIKKELKQTLLIDTRNANFKNFLMIGIPVLGWIIFFYRFLTEATPFFQSPPSKLNLILESSIEV